MSSPEAGDSGPEMLWPAVGAIPQLEAQSIHVWSWRVGGLPRLDQTSDVVTTPDAMALLSEEERARAGRFVSAARQARFVEAHAGLRTILGGYLGLRPGEVAFSKGEHGKPELAGNSGLRFNLSHSRDLAILGVSCGVELGVDVEYIRPASAGIAERFFSEPEIAALAQVQPADYLAAFYACWTRKEAFLKGLGTGISGGLHTFSVSIAMHAEPELSDREGLTRGWKLKHLEPATGYIGALACSEDECGIQCMTPSWDLHGGG